MPMTRAELINAIIDDGITEVPLAYKRPDQNHMRDGAIAGFNACRGLDDDALLALGVTAAKDTIDAFTRQDARYWWYRMFQVQVEWTINVLSAASLAQGLPTLATPTARGMAKAVDILS